MRNYSVRSKGSKGFTLIELLIVIALLGALAIGLLATIDPFEQLKKGRDTSQRNTLSELYNAALRYYSIRGYFPWNTATSTVAQTGAVYPTFASAVSDMVSVGELKNRFQELAGTGNLAKMYITSPTSEEERVCFMPESKSFQAEANTIFDQTGGTSGQADCKGAGGTSTTCYYCIQ